MVDNTTQGADDVAWRLETTFDDASHVLVTLTQSWDVAVTSSIAYVIFVFGGRRLMKNRERFDLRFPLIMWSTFLAIFSITGTIRVWGLGVQMYRNQGVRGLVCDTSFYNGGVGLFWSVVFLYSKFAEYVDTVFIVLRKQKLIFLHWYHHFTVALFCWLTFRGKYAGSFIFMAANFFVHALMYTYYAMRAAGVKIPKPVAKIITTSQIVQMVIGCVTMFAVMTYSSDASTCTSSNNYVITGGVMYASYLVLFINFFYQSYHPNKNRLSTSNRDQQSNGTVTSQAKTKRKESARSSDYQLRQRKPSTVRS